MSENAQKELTPSAKVLMEKVQKILDASKAKTNGKGFIDSDIQSALLSLKTNDITELNPPSTESGMWTNDHGFCKRLGARVFGVSPESVDELPWQTYFMFIQIINANFIKSLEGAIPS